MNQDTTATSFPHLDFGDLIAEASGQPVGDRVREHLAGCEACQLEGKRWNLVADGVRGLVADVHEETPEAFKPAKPRRRRRRALGVPARRTLAAVGGVAAAFALLLGLGAAAGLVHVSLSGSSGQPTLTAFSGCAQLEQATGTLVGVDGSGVVIKTAGGHEVTVTTTKATRLSAFGALLGDIKDGATVVVAGTNSGATIAANYVVVGSNPSLTIPGIVVVRGTVSDAGAGGFTVVTSAGTRVPVTTSGGTVVTVVPARLSQLQSGRSTIAVGHPGPDGTLSAMAVIQPPDWPAGGHATVSVHGCSHTAINKEILALAAGS